MVEFHLEALRDDTMKSIRKWKKLDHLHKRVISSSNHTQEVKIKLPIIFVYDLAIEGISGAIVNHIRGSGVGKRKKFEVSRKGKIVAKML